MRWKGYSPAHNSWENEDDVFAPELVEEYYNNHPDAIRSIITPSREHAIDQGPMAEIPHDQHVIHSITEVVTATKCAVTSRLGR